MTTLSRRVLEDSADEAQDRIARWDRIRDRLERDLATLTADDKHTTVDLSDTIDAIQDAAAKLQWAAICEERDMPDVDRIYRSGQVPSSY